MIIADREKESTIIKGTKGDIAREAASILLVLYESDKILYTALLMAMSDRIDKALKEALKEEKLLEELVALVEYFVDDNQELFDEETD